MAVGRQGQGLRSPAPGGRPLCAHPPAGGQLKGPIAPLRQALRTGTDRIADANTLQDTAKADPIIGDA